MQSKFGHDDASSLVVSVLEQSEISDISDNSDFFHVEAVSSEVPRTTEDAMLIVRSTVPHWREYPLLLGADNSLDSCASFMNVSS